MYCLGLGLVISLQVWYSITRDVHVDSINTDWYNVTALVWGCSLDGSACHQYAMSGQTAGQR